MSKGYLLTKSSRKQCATIYKLLNSCVCRSPRKRKTIINCSKTPEGFQTETRYIPFIVRYDVHIDFEQPIPFVCNKIPEASQEGNKAVVILPLLQAMSFEFPTVYEEIEYLYFTIELREDSKTGVSDSINITWNLYNQTYAPYIHLTEKEQRKAYHCLNLQLKSRGTSCEQLLKEAKERKRR